MDALYLVRAVFHLGIEDSLTFLRLLGEMYDFPIFQTYPEAVLMRIDQIMNRREPTSANLAGDFGFDKKQLIQICRDDINSESPRLVISPRDLLQKVIIFDRGNVQFQDETKPHLPSPKYEWELDYTSQPSARRAAKMIAQIEQWLGQTTVPGSIETKVVTANGYPLFISDTGIPCKYYGQEGVGFVLNVQDD